MEAFSLESFLLLFFSFLADPSLTFSELTRGFLQYNIIVMLIASSGESGVFYIDNDADTPNR